VTAVQALTVTPEEAELRLDRWFRQHYPELGHGRLEKLLRTGQVRVDGKRAKSGTRLAAGQVVRVPPLKPPESGSAVKRTAPAADPRDLEALRASVLYRDEAVIAIDKPAGLAVQGGSGQHRHIDAMLDGLRFGRDERPRLVHRLDKDTGGVLLLARTAAAARKLTAAFKGKAAQKVYWALVVGAPPEPRGIIDLPLAKAGGLGAEKMATVADGAADGKSAQTLYQVVQTRKVAGAAVTWLVLMPLTGRTHQLRAHCALLGAPILYDGKYGGRTAFPEGLASDGKTGIPRRLMLLAREIAVPHPEHETTLRVEAPPPAHMEAALAALGFKAVRGERASDDLIGYAEGLAHSPPGSRPGPKKDRTAAGKSKHRKAAGKSTTAGKSTAAGKRKAAGKSKVAGKRKQRTAAGKSTAAGKRTAGRKKKS
jgi:23S rRNA pseudouridine955/2504/2580 synthase